MHITALQSHSSVSLVDRDMKLEDNSVKVAFYMSTPVLTGPMKTKYSLNGIKKI